MSDDTFLGEVETGIEANELEQLGAMINLLRDKRGKIETATTDLKDLEKEERILSREQIPDFLLSRGLREVTLADGAKVKVEDKISVKLPKDLAKRKVVLRWVVTIGGENLISDSLTVSDPEKSIKDYLIEQGIPFKLDRDIHHARFKSFVAGKLGLKKGSLPEIESTDVPAEANLYIYKETDIE